MTISVCIPIYNVEKYIRRCLDSIISQTYSDLEIIVVNDSTPDNSMQIVKDYAQIDNRISIIEHESNMGLMMARRTAYMAAKGEYITFVDSDDYIPSTAIENLVKSIESTDADIVSGTIEYISIDGKTEKYSNVLRYGNDSRSALKSLLKKEFGHNLCSKAFRRQLLQNYQYESITNCNNGEDGLLFYQVLRNCANIVSISDIVYYYCQNLQSSSQTSLSESGIRTVLQLNNLRKCVCEKYPELQILLFNYISPTVVSLRINTELSESDFKRYVLHYDLEYFYKVNNIIRFITISNAVVLLRQYCSRCFYKFLKSTRWQK